MRAVNLIPGDQRKGSGGSGPSLQLPQGGQIVGYILVGVLALVLGAAYMLVSASNQVSERETTVATLEQELQVATARADALSGYTEFAARSEARNVTVASLAQSRFDWERVMRELALVIPGDVWLTQLAGTALSPDDSITGPSLTIDGCADGHEAVAELAEALEDIDGVTRVGVSSSELRERVDSASSGGGTGASDDGECRTRDFISKFSIVVAFDAVAGSGATTVPGVPDAAQPVPAAPADGSQQASAAPTGEVVK